jgi:4-hydroxy-2-oxoheptanedioate aldolase
LAELVSLVGNQFSQSEWERRTLAWLRPTAALGTSLQVLLNRKRIAEKGNLQPDVVPMVRIPPNARERDQWVIKQALDTGVYGLVLPHLNTVEDAQAAVAAARYPQVPGVQDFAPAGERGWGNRIASRYWGLTPTEYYDAADLWPLDPDGNVLLMGIIEEAEGVRNIRDILHQVRGIGAIWAGSGDMSVSMGLRGQASHPTVQENVLRVLAACKEFGVPCATIATADDVAMRLEQGFRIIMTPPVRSTPGLVEGRRLAAR